MIVFLPGAESPVEIDTSAADGIPWGTVGAALILTGGAVWAARQLALIFRALAPVLLGIVIVVGILAVLAGVSFGIER